MNELTKTALFWLNLGIATIPVLYRGKTPTVPGGWGRYAEELPSENQIRNWFATSLHNIAVVAGWNRLTVLDFDDMGSFLRWNEYARINGGVAGKVRKNARFELSSRGVHFFIRTEEKTENGKLEGIDILADRKYCITAPSIHPSGREYRLISPTEPLMIGSVREIFPAEWFAKAEEEKRKQAELTVSRESSDPWSIAGEAREAMSAGIVERIRSRLRIEDIFPDAIPSGGDWMSVRCPLHDDNRPSAGINTREQYFVCFNHCYGNKPLDVIGLYAETHHVSNSEAIRELSKRV